MSVKPFFRPFRVSATLAAAALAVAAALCPAVSETISPPSSGVTPGGPTCAAPGELIHLAQPLSRIAKHLHARQPIKIVALGSSSTAGAGASSPANSYPSRLEVELRALFPQRDISVVNRGVNGDEARDMLARLDNEVLAEKPDLVLWQAGSNSVLRDHPLAPAATLLHEGLARLKASGADVVLIDPQFAPKVLAKVDIDNMVELIETTAKLENVGLFHRFALMRYWRQTANIPYQVILSSDELHMNDWSYGCVAKLLARSIAEASTRATVTATAVAPR